jgi:Fe-S cluster assembly iron-binding protein IscA
MSLFEITDAAKGQIEKLLEKNPSKYAVSLEVLGGGCAGFK